MSVNKVDSNEFHHEWLNAETWPPPKWLQDGASGHQINDYTSFLTHVLRARYLELEGDFRIIFGIFGGTPVVDKVTAGRIVDLLRSSRDALQRDDPNLFTVSSMLDLVDRYMVWLYPDHVALAFVPRIHSQIDALERSDKEHLRALLRNLTETENQRKIGELRAVFDEVISAWNDQKNQKEISNGLQIERLKALSRWGFILLIVFLLSCPLIINPHSLEQWPLTISLADKINPTAWLAALGVGLVGAAGGFLSGLLQVRNSQVGLAQYQESMLKLRLKPLVGSIAAVVLFVLLSWQILPGIVVQNAGSYICLAFISGFSERYFLKLLDIKLDDRLDEKPAQGQVADSKKIEPASQQSDTSEK